MPPLVSVTLVTYNSAAFVPSCLESIFAQQYQELEVVVVDNASSDSTRALLAAYDGRIRLILNDHNAGFAAAQNQAIAASSGKWVLVINPDTQISPRFVSRLVAAGEEYARERVGTVCGKLLAMEDDLTIPTPPLVDSAGIFFTPTLRHFDRGSRRPDVGRYEKPEFVFGASGAAALYKREMIEDISHDGEFFDPDFFTYREDADLSWRAQLLGWKCLYVPKAVGYHVRTAQPWNRAKLPPEINMHSVKNRFLMRVKNIGASLYLRNAVPIAARDLCILFYCLTVERSSLAAFGRLIEAWPRAWRKRRWIQSRRRVGDAELARWFRFRPVAFPATRRLYQFPAGASRRLGAST